MGEALVDFQRHGVVLRFRLRLAEALHATQILGIGGEQVVGLNRWVVQRRAGNVDETEERIGDLGQ